MKLCILGAGGNSGRALVREALARGHEVSAFARTPAKLAEFEHPRLRVRDVLLSDHGALTEAFAGHDAVINAAGNVGDGEAFTTLVRGVIRAADAALGAGGRVWLYGGAALLRPPGSSIRGVDLPGVPKVYEAHRINFEAVRATKLDWSMLCPGPMIASPDGKATEGLIVSAGVWPTGRPLHTYVLPPVALSLAFKQAVPRMTIYYEDGASVILDNLDKSGPYSRKCVGIALPGGATRFKANAIRS